MLRFLLLIGLFVILNLRQEKNSQPDDMLRRKITMTVHSSEILESVVYRLYLQTNIKIDFNVRMLAPYLARPAVYKNTALKDILDHQFKETQIRYLLKNEKLVLYQAIP